MNQHTADAGQSSHSTGPARVINQPLATVATAARSAPSVEVVMDEMSVMTPLLEMNGRRRLRRTGDWLLRFDAATGESLGALLRLPCTVDDPSAAPGETTVQSHTQRRSAG